MGESEPWGTEGFTADTELDASTHLLLSYPTLWGGDDSESCHSSFLSLSYPKSMTACGLEGCFVCSS